MQNPIAVAIEPSAPSLENQEVTKHITMALDWRDKVVFYNGQIVPIGAATFIKCDVFDEDQLMNSFQAVLEEQGYIDVVVNYAFLMNDSKEAYRKMINVNFTSLVNSTLKSIELMSKENGRRGGTVINIASIIALFQSHLLPIYSATKSAILMFSNCIGRQEYYSRTGVRVITVALGAYDTPILHPDNLKSFDKHVEAIIYYRVESAAQGMVDVFKLAETGSTWIVVNDRPAKDITTTIKEAYELMSIH
ncbi:putative alcohol dehydrogenase, partial [Operophtera brumata]